MRKLFLFFIPLILFCCNEGEVNLSKEEQEELFKKHIPINLEQFLEEQFHNAFAKNDDEGITVTYLRNEPTYQKLNEEILPFFFLWIKVYKAGDFKQEGLIIIAIKNKTEIASFQYIGNIYIEEYSNSIPSDVYRKIKQLNKK